MKKIKEFFKNINARNISRSLFLIMAIISILSMEYSNKPIIRFLQFIILLTSAIYYEIETLANNSEVNLGINYRRYLSEKENKNVHNNNR